MKNYSTFITIAIRNLSRHKIKTILTAAAIMVSVAVYIFMRCWIGGMSVESRLNIINFDMGAAQLQTKSFFENKDELPSYENFTQWEKFANALYDAGYNAAPRYSFAATMFSQHGTAPMVVHGIDPALEGRVLRYDQYIDFGRFPQNGAFEIALGAMAAEKLRVGIPQRPRRLELAEFVEQIANNTDDAEFVKSMYVEQPIATGINALYGNLGRVVEGNERMILKRGAAQNDLERLWELVAASDRNNVRINALIKTGVSQSGAAQGVHQLISAVVTGIINSPDPAVNGNVAFIPLDVLQDEHGMLLYGAVTSLLIRRKDAHPAELPGAFESAATITAAIERGLGGSLPENLAVRSWLDYSQDYLSFEQMENGLTMFVSMLLFFLSFLGISNTILLAILERTKEIGMMRAMGLTDGEMKVIYMLEAGMLGLIGSILGIILGCAINYPMVEHGWDFSNLADALGGDLGFRVNAVFRSVWDVPTIIGTGIVATFLSSLMAYLPMRRIVKQPITDSLRFE